MVRFGVKAAIFPFHAWLPRVAVAPTPVTALLHAVAVVKAGAFAIIRITYYSYGTNLLAGTYAQDIILILAMVTILYGSVRAVKEPHLKRRLAYSTISNLSYIVFGAALMTPVGMAGGMTHLIMHAFIKISLFCCVGAILHRSGLEYINSMEGIGKRMPFVVTCFFISSLALIGVPPLSGFVSKWNLGTAAVSTSKNLPLAGMFTLIISAFLTAAYLFSFLLRAVFPTKDAEEKEAFFQASDPGWRMRLPILFFTIMAVILGVFAKPVAEFLTKVSNGLI